MSDETTTGASTATGEPGTPQPAMPTPSQPAAPAAADGPPAAAGDSPASAGNGPAGSGAPGTGAPRRRRRGSRGGRNRRKPASSTAGTEGRGPGPFAGPVPAGHDYNDEAADRGLTTEDVAEEAREEAGLVGVGRPRIGDSRPAP